MFLRNKPYSVRGIDGIMYEEILEAELQLTKDRW